MKKFISSPKLLLAVIVATLTGCSAPQVKERYFWPRLPETPRIEWLGTYKGSLDITEPSLMDKILEQELPVQLKSPTFIAADGEGMAYVSDQKNGAVLIFNFNKKTVTRLGEESLEKPTYPIGVALDEEGNLYVVDGKKLQLFVYSKTEMLKFSRSLTDIKSAAAMAIDPARKRLIIPEVRGHRIVLLDYEGNLVSSFGERGTGDGQFNYPTSVAVDRGGNIYVCDSQNARIQKFSPEGKFLFKFGKRGDRPGDFSVIKTVAVDSEDHIYVTDAKINNFAIFSDKGEYLLSVGAGYGFDGRRVMPGGFLVPQGIFIDKNDTIYVADQLNARMQVFQYLNDKYLQKHPVTEGKPAEDLEEKAKMKKKK